jgi:FkbM family methyltransferase
MLKSALKSIIPTKAFSWGHMIRKDHFDGYSIKSYSQEGEDMILRRFFDRQPSGFYVDVGAHHPKRFSNTYYFYKRGWRGINIDAMPKSMEAFKKLRPRDINLEIPIGVRDEILKYYMFSEPAYNGFDGRLSASRHGVVENHVIESAVDLATRRLDDVLNENLPLGQSIDFLTVDVEGLDLEVLQSNDWGKFRPTLVLAEILGATFQEISEGAISVFLANQDYEIFAKSLNTVFFKKRSD